MKIWVFGKHTKRDDPIVDPEEVDRAAFADRMIAMGYKLWLYTPPINIEEIEICAYRFERPSVIRKSDVNPEWNIAGVWWRPVGSLTIDADAAD